MTTKRADLILHELGFFESRAKARAAIEAGLVSIDGSLVTKPSTPIAETAQIVASAPHPWVSRGGVKLEHALTHFSVDPTGRYCLDVGASTGGFTDVLLAKGARKVFAVDVGHNQLAWKLREDPRVVVMEKTNARHLTSTAIPEPVDLVVCDASFIPLHLVLAAQLGLARKGARLVALIKPQFEVGPDRVGKGGIVRDPALWQETCERIAAFVARQPGWRVLGITASPIEGRDGNREFLIAAVREG
mgnify:CR=1 FL=1